MTTYMTPEKFRTMGFGIDLDDLEDPVQDVELASILSRATSIVHGYCAVPRLPRPFSFLGGVITAENPEQHAWKTPENDFDVGQRRIYPYAWPIKTVSSFKVKVTNTQYVSIAPTEIFINNTERYVEVISLAFTGVGLFGAIIPSLGLMRPVAELGYTYGYDFEEVDERLYPTDARTYRAQHQFWETTPAPEISVNGAVVADTTYTVDSEEGTVVFDDQQGPDDKVTASYTHKLPVEIRDALGMIAVHLLGEREVQRRGMEGVQSIKVGEVTITKPSKKLSAENIAYIEPEAAWLLDGFKFTTLR